MNVIISVPHAGCKPGPRNCDRTALQFAMFISKALVDERITNEVYIYNAPRSIIDANRPEARNTPFRKMIDDRVSNLEKSDVLLDIHSAPFDTIKMKFDAYLLDIADLSFDDEFNLSLYDYLLSNDFDVHILEGTIENDIVVIAMRKSGMKNVSLIEINESLPKKRVFEIASAIARFIRRRDDGMESFK